MPPAIRVIESSDERQVSVLLDRRIHRNPEVTERVARIVDDVRRRGDAAVIEYARQFDTLTEPVEVTADEIDAAVKRV
ncbi:MAG: histidinol dehydrogenase, partial [Acidobacteria bacterium]|nr:histidinol dehydrogenase [Acidobacteriota bacterium]